MGKRDSNLSGFSEEWVKCNVDGTYVPRRISLELGSDVTF